MNRKHRLAQKRSARLANNPKQSSGVTKGQAAFFDSCNKKAATQRLIDRVSAEVGGVSRSCM